MATEPPQTQTQALPLIAGFAADAPFAWHEGRRLTQGAFVAQAQRLADALPDTPYLLNLCDDRYRFMLAFAAACLRGQTNLLPSGASAAAIEAARVAYPQCTRIDNARVDAALAGTGAGVAAAAPLIDARHPAAVLFTSGSTGAPQAQAKHWAAMAAIGAHLRARLLPAGGAQIVATVPPQHMYGLETTVLMPLAGAGTVHGGRPFFPQDVAQALAAVPAPRVLVTTPVHLRALIESGTALPPLQFVLSATAPLSAELAARIEHDWAAPVHEIYGCTEAGSMATRRTTAGAHWQLLSGLRLRLEDGAASVEASHLPEPVPLQDRIEDDGAAGFRLLGRNADLLKVAGKRASLSELSARLLAVPGVQDAVIFSVGDGEAARPAALVVAPDVPEAVILQALAAQIDPVFLPRPLRRVAQLPRNELGKLPRALLLELLERSR